MSNLDRFELTRLWRAPYADRLATVRALEAAVEAAPLIRRHLKDLTATIRGLPVSSLSADRRVLAVIGTIRGEVWVCGPEECSGSTIDAACAGLEDLAFNPDGPTVFNVENLPVASATPDTDGVPSI